MSEHGDTTDTTDTVKTTDKTIALIKPLAEKAVQPVGLIMRHSVRTFLEGVHDLENNLTEEGRDCSLAFGQKLPKSYSLRGYASPPRRCVETCELILEGHREAGGAVSRTRPIEALSVFYVLDQMKMFKILRAEGDLRSFTARWMRGELAPDVVMDAPQAARIIMAAMAAKLKDRPDETRLDLFVSHDMTLHLLKACLLDEPPEDGKPVQFLEGIAFHFDDDALVMQSVSAKFPTRHPI